MDWVSILVIVGFGLLSLSIKPLRLKWLARTLKVPISFVQILGIMYQSFDPRDILAVYHFTHRIDMPIALEDLIRQAKAGSRIRSVVKAMEMAKNAGVSIDFNELCEMERESDTNIMLVVKEMLRSKGSVSSNTSL